MEQIVDDLLHGRRLRLKAGDAEEKEAIIAAARLAAARSGPQRMSPVFRRRLARILDTDTREPRLTRRAALVAGLGVAAGALAGGIVGKALAPPAAPMTLSASSPVVPRNGRWTDVGSVADFVEGQFRRGETVTAVSSMCSHLPCELWWESGSSLLECPCHPVAFTSDGKPSSPSYTLPALNEVKVRVTAAGRVEVLGT